MKRIGRRMTKQKKIILDILRATTSHPTADWVYEQARITLPDISLGTIYRNLKLLAEMGEIMELNYGSTYSRYDGEARPHYHFMCKECGAVRDVHIGFSIDHSLVAEKIGGIVENHRMEFYGVCGGCKSE